MELIIRQERPADYDEVHALVKLAFAEMPYADGNEQDLVSRLRKSKSFVPELSLVAVADNKVIGHILLTKLNIESTDKTVASLALAPVSVLPDFQHQGIGSRLIESAHKIAVSLGFESIILIGHEKYYPRFGYVKLSHYEISIPFEVPPQNAMICELIPGALNNVSGSVIYDPAFFQ